jgi:hypothetical protein
MKEKYIEIRNMNGLRTIQVSKENFILFVNSFLLSQVRVVVASQTTINETLLSSRFTKRMGACFIWNHFLESINLGRETDDELPELTVNECTEEDETNNDRVSWFIDNTPSINYLEDEFILPTPVPHSLTTDFVSSPLYLYFNNNDSDNFIPFARNLDDEFEQTLFTKLPIEISYCKEIQKNDDECNICYESTLAKDFVKLNCNHDFCVGCIKKILTSAKSNDNKKPCCAFCRNDIQSLSIYDEDCLKLITPLCI